MLKDLFASVKEGYINVWNGRTKKSTWFRLPDELDLALEQAKEISESGADAYFSLCPQEEPPAKGRGKADGVMCVPFVWVEIDVQHPTAHKNDKYPPNAQSVKILLEELGVEPSYMVHSGHGYHVYWILDEPLEPEEGAEIVEGWQTHIRDIARKHDWMIDKTSDLARVLRVPDTKNWKDPNNPKDVKVLINMAHRYSKDIFCYKKPRKFKDTTYVANPNEYDARRMIARCPYFASMYENKQYVPEPEWHTLLTNAALCHNGLNLVEEMHEWCRPASEGYTWKETLEKFMRAQNEEKPHTCEFIMENFMPRPCKSCPYDIVSSPITLASYKHGWIDAMDRIKSNETEDPIEDLAIIRAQKEDKYKEAKHILMEKGRIGSGAERKVNLRATEIMLGSSETTRRKFNSLDDMYPDYPVHGVNMPKGYKMGDEGVITIVTDSNNMPKKVVRVSPVPLGIKARHKDVDTGEEKVALTWYMDDEWQTVVEKRSVVFDRNKIIRLADSGLPVSSERSKEMVKYLTEFEDCNRHVFRPIRSISRYGWVSATEFVPYGAPDIEVDLDSSVRGCYVHGDLDAWKDMVSPLYDIPEARAMMSASFAVPLLKILKLRSMIVHLWSSTGKGKTATLRSALSVWGDADRMMVNFNATKVGIETRAAQFCDLPLGIDEKQAGTLKNNFMNIVIYVVSGGVGRTRGRPDGTLDVIRHWRTIALTNGEHPLVEDTATGGAKTRSVEIRFPKLNDELLHDLHEGVQDHYGHAGDKYIEHLLGHSREKVRKYYQSVHEFLMKQDYQKKSRSHMDLIACIATGDYFSRQWVFNVDEETAHKEAMNLAIWLASSMEDEEQRDETKKAFDMFCSWVWGNADHFRGGSASEDLGVEQYGEFEGNYVLIVPHKFEQLMREFGYSSPKRILTDLKERGLMVTEKGRFTVRSTSYQRNRRVRMYKFDLSDDIHIENFTEVDIDEEGFES